MRRKARAARLAIADRPRALAPVAGRTRLPSFIAVLAALGCSSEPAITAEPLRMEVSVRAAQPASDPHEEPPPIVEPEPVLEVVTPKVAPAPAKKKLEPKHHWLKPPTPTFLEPDPFPYMLGGDIESVRIGPQILSIRRA